MREGKTVSDPGDAYKEVGFVCFDITEVDESNEAILRHVPRNHIEEMRKVFLGGGESMFGHDYWSLITSESFDQMSFVVDRLTKKPYTRKAVMVLGGQVGREWVPCINVLHFFQSDDKLCVTYFSRGQDMWNKFCPDVIAIRDIQKLVAARLPSLALGNLRGTISSAHVYCRDFAAASAALMDG